MEYWKINMRNCPEYTVELFSVYFPPITFLSKSKNIAYHYDQPSLDTIPI